MVEGNGLENRQARKGLVGSNPTLSAIVSVLALASKETIVEKNENPLRFGGVKRAEQ